jgi:hypothetical protein
LINVGKKNIRPLIGHLKRNASSNISARASDVRVFAG